MLLFVSYVMKKYILTFLLLLFPLTKLGSKEIIDLGECKSSKLSSSGFKKLKEKLKDSRIVFIGEQSHGVATDYENFANIVKYLHEELNFNIIAEEFCFFTINQINSNKDFTSAQEYRNAMYWPQGNAKENDILFDYIDSCSNTENPIIVEGFDSRIFQRKLYYQFIDSTLSDKFDIDKKRYLNTLDNLLKLEYKDTLTTIEDKYLFIEDTKKLIKLLDNPDVNNRIVQIFRSLIGFAKNAWNPSNISDDDVDRYSYRSKQMAQNLIWLCDVIYPEEKIIVRAHIGHSSKNLKSLHGYIPNKFSSDSLNLGSLVNNHFGDKSFHIATTFYLGTYCNWKFEPMTIPNPSDSSLEYELVNDGYKYAFVSLDTEDLIEMNYGDFNNYSNNESWQAPFGKLFDGIIFINNGTAPTKKNND